MRETKKIFTLLTLVTLISSFAVGCGDETPGGDEKTTTSQTATTTVSEVTTIEPTTPEPTTPIETTIQEETTTEYVRKGESFIVDASLKDYFIDLTIQKGDKIYLNNLIGKGEGMDEKRGAIGYKLVNVLFYENNIEKYNEFVYTYEVIGTTSYSVPYEKNVVIEYNEVKKMYFHFVKEAKGRVVFDVYEID